MTTLRIPITIGKNRVRGNKEGAMFTYDRDLHKVRSIIKELRIKNNMSNDKETIDKDMRGILNYYHKQHIVWLNGDDRGETIGHVEDITLNDEHRLILGDERLLNQSWEGLDG